jgi:hypothetical protein
MMMIEHRFMHRFMHSDVQIPRSSMCCWEFSFSSQLWHIGNQCNGENISNCQLIQ